MKNKILSMLISIVLLGMFFSFAFTSNVNAKSENIVEPNTNDEIYINEALKSCISKEVKPLSTNSDYEWLMQNYNNFKVYHTDQFSQFYIGNNCGPTAVANILSYYESMGFDLYPGDTITQSVYDEIANEIGFTSQGTMFGMVYRGVKLFAERAGYGFEHDVYLLDLWSDVTRDIRYGYPIIANTTGDHVEIILGYREIGGVRQIYTCTGWSTLEFQWLNFDDTNIQMESVHIYWK